MDNFIDTICTIVAPMIPSGIQLCKCTGNFLEGDKSYVEVIIRGKLVYAKLCLPIGYSFAPHPEWLEQNKDRIGFYVSYEANNPAHPIILGMTYMDDVEPLGAKFPEQLNIKSSNFDISLDDNGEELTINRFDGDSIKQEVKFEGESDIIIRNADGNSIKVSGSEISIETSGGKKLVINDQSISMGKAHEVAVLGNTLLGIMSEMLTAISTMTVLCAPPSSPSTPPVNAAQFVALQARLNTILSKSIKIE